MRGQQACLFKQLLVQLGILNTALVNATEREEEDESVLLALNKESADPSSGTHPRHLHSLVFSLHFSEMTPASLPFSPAFWGKVSDGKTTKKLCHLPVSSTLQASNQTVLQRSQPQLEERRMPQSQVGKRDGSLTTKTLAPGYAASQKPKSENFNG